MTSEHMAKVGPVRRQPGVLPYFYERGSFERAVRSSAASRHLAPAALNFCFPYASTSGRCSENGEIFASSSLRLRVFTIWLTLQPANAPDRSVYQQHLDDVRQFFAFLDSREDTAKSIPFALSLCLCFPRFL